MRRDTLQFNYWEWEIRIFISYLSKILKITAPLSFKHVFRNSCSEFSMNFLRNFTEIYRCESKTNLKYFSVASMADGMRCDMAFLLLNDNIQTNWGYNMQSWGYSRPSEEWWVLVDYNVVVWQFQVDQSDQSGESKISRCYICCRGEVLYLFVLSSFSI